MFGSPNQYSVSDLKAWWSGANSVDFVDIDWYLDLSTSPTFDSVYSHFYNCFTLEYSEHIVVGNTDSTSHGPACSCAQCPDAPGFRLLGKNIKNPRVRRAIAFEDELLQQDTWLRSVKSAYE